MSFFSRKKKPDVPELASSSPQGRSAIQVAVPPKSAASPSPRSTPAPARGGSLFAGMNFGEGASSESTTKPDADKAESAAPSGFSFLNKSAPTDDTGGGGESEPAAPSGFSFLSKSAPADDAGDVQAEPVSQSGFSFLNKSTPADDAAPASAKESQDVTEHAPAATAASSESTAVGMPGSSPSKADSPALSSRSQLKADSPASGRVATAPASSTPAVPMLATPALSTSSTVSQPSPASGSSPPLATQTSAKKKKKTKAVRPGFGRQEAEGTKTSPHLTRATAAEANQAPAAAETLVDESASSSTGVATPSSGPSKASSQLSLASDGQGIEKDSAEKMTPSADSSASSLQPAGAEEPTEMKPDEPLPAGSDDVSATAAVAGTKTETEYTDGVNPESPIAISTHNKEPTSQVDSTGNASSEQLTDIDASKGDGAPSAAPSLASPVADSSFSELANTSGESSNAVEPNAYEYKLTAEERLSLHMQSEASQFTAVESSVHSAEDRAQQFLLSHLAAQRQRLTQRCTAAELRKLEAAAIAQENYEEAEKHSAELKEIDDALSHESSASPTVNKLVSLNDERTELISSRCSLQRESVTTVQRLLKDQQAEMGSHQQLLADGLTQRRQEIATQREALVRDQSHMDVDWDLFKRSEDKLQGEENEKTGLFRRQLEELSTRRSKMQADIDELEAQLRTLRSQAQLLDEEIESENAKIEEVLQVMVDQRSRQDDQRHGLQSRQDSLDRRKADIAEAEKAAEQSSQELTADVERCEKAEGQVSGLVERHTLALATADGDIETVKTFIDLFTETRKENPTNPTLAKLESSLAEKQSEADAITHKLVVSQKEVASIRKKLSGIESQLPDLEEAKKTAAASRKFGDAKRLKQEQEQLVEEQTGLEAALQAEREKSAEYNSVLKEIQEQLDSLRLDYVHAEKESDMELVSKFTLYSDRLQELLDSVDAAFAAGYLGRLVRLEQNYCKVLCGELQLKHGQEVDVTDLLSNPNPDGSAGDDVGQSVLATGESVDGPAQTDVPADTTPTTANAEQRRSLQSQIAELEEALEKAIEVEDYDTADQINTDLETLRRNLSSLS